MVILLAEDERLVRSVITSSLEELGCKVVEADCGDAAWDLIEQSLRFDLLITDVRMPGSIDGIELAHRVRSRNDGAKIIIMSGYVGERDPAAHGFNTFLPKPFTAHQLSSLIGAVTADPGTPVA